MSASHGAARRRSLLAGLGKSVKVKTALMANESSIGNIYTIKDYAASLLSSASPSSIMTPSRTCHVFLAEIFERRFRLRCAGSAIL
jgi:hypothetical protein